MKSFFRENLAIVVAVSLPIVVIALFAAATVIPTWVVGPPAYDLILTHGVRHVAGDRSIRVSVDVVEGRLRARVAGVGGRDFFEGQGPIVFEGRSPAVIPGEAMPSLTFPNLVPRLFVFDAATRRTREIEIRIPTDGPALAAGDELPIPELADVRLDTSLRSLDGWWFEPYLDQSGPGLFVGPFGGWYGRQQARLTKGGAVVRVSTSDGGFGPNQLRFLGWIVE